jgi:hypothetical protein
VTLSSISADLLNKLSEILAGKFSVPVGKSFKNEFETIK